MQEPRDDAQEPEVAVMLELKGRPGSDAYALGLVESFDEPKSVYKLPLWRRMRKLIEGPDY